VSLVHLRLRRSACAPSADSAIRETIVEAIAGARNRRIAALIAAAALVTGCSPDDDDDAAETTAPVVQLGGPGETNRVLTSDEISDLSVPGYADADVAFVHGMIAHHEQALAVTAMVEDRAERDDLPLFAERIDVSQHDEIAQLEGWLEQRDEGTEDAEHAEHGELMPGMLTDDELAQLEAASGRRFDRLFLQYMIRHHEGAVTMVEQLLTGGQGGQESQLFQLAQHVETDQQVEIARMKQLLSEVEAER
jgi:uncharacterized protein (DUF305 family)